MMDWVMIVDDDATSLEAASQALNGVGIRVTAMQSGRALIDYLNENPALSPDLVLLDSVMPGQDGFETLKALRRAREGREGTLGPLQHRGPRPQARPVPRTAPFPTRSARPDASGRAPPEKAADRPEVTQGCGAGECGHRALAAAEPAARGEKRSRGFASLSLPSGGRGAGLRSRRAPRSPPFSAQEAKPIAVAQYE